MTVKMAYRNYFFFSLPESPGIDFGEDSLRAAVVHVTSKYFVYLRLIGLI